MTSVRTRIAPSPTGHPHIGTVFQALVNYVYAQKNQGKFIVRIEDTDRGRLVADAEQKLFQSFSWAGIIPDESVIAGGNFGPYRQSERLESYHQHVNKLLSQGDAYYCFCSPERLDTVRKQLQKEGKPPMYDQHCRQLDPGKASIRAQSEAHVVRMKVPANTTITFTDVLRGEISFDSNLVDDQVILKSDGFPTYHLAVVVDDHLMQISHIVRGEEWISSTPKHILLYQYFNWPIPAIIHTPLLRNPDKSKLSKRHGHASVEWYINHGYLPEAVVNFLISRVWNHPQSKEIYDLSEIIKYFDFKDMHIQGPIVDLDKLNWLNGQWIRSLSDPLLIAKLKDFQPQELSTSLLTKILPLIKDRLVTLADLKSLTHYFYQTPSIDLKTLLKQAKMTEKETSAYFDRVEKSLQTVTNWQALELEENLRQLQQDMNLKPRPAFMTLRYALTGELATPPLFDIIQVLGRSETITRLHLAQKLLLPPTENN
jgi:glutamyl-tRNA synthetase